MKCQFCGESMKTINNSLVGPVCDYCLGMKKSNVQLKQKSLTPSHYASSPNAIQPWHLQRWMKSSGNVFVDARRTDVIEYAFRLKDDLLGDLKKARHCLDEAINVLEDQAKQSNKVE